MHKSGYKPGKQKAMEHGGDIVNASQRYGIVESDWLDLSTGINPNGWPVPEVPAEIWQRLPERNTLSLNKAACKYYGSQHARAIAGSQAVIQLLPQLPRFRMHRRVGIVSPTYSEHAAAWLAHDYQVEFIGLDEVDEKLVQLDVLVVVNPNNPTGDLVARDTLLCWHQQLQQRDGVLIVDEAFMDCTPEYSIASEAHQPGLIVLRSLGKFFGLAGLRCGFCLASESLLNEIALRLGPWTVNGPAVYLAEQALNDKAWHESSRKKLRADGERLHQLLSNSGLPTSTGTALFRWFIHDDAWNIVEHVARQGILLRYFPGQHTGKPSLRFGLPASEAQWQLLEKVLNSLPLTFNKACEV